MDYDMDYYMDYDMVFAFKNPPSTSILNELTAE